jgi:DNA-binding CsgD family transcriptional regulator
VGRDAIRWQDARSLLLLASEGRELGPRSQACRDHLLAGIVRLVGAEFGMFVMDPAFRPGGRGRLLHLTVQGFERAVVPGLDFVLDVGRDVHPLLRSLAIAPELARPHHLETASRSERVTSREWYESSFMVDHMLPARYDDWLASVRAQGDGVVSGIGLIRAKGDRPFSSSQQLVVRLFHEACDTLMVPPACPAASLPPRLREALGHLLAGASDKDIASAMRISHHTAREYTKRLLAAFGTASRAQLIARAGRLTARSPSA